MQFRLVVGKLLQLKHRGLLVLLGFYEVCLCLCFALTLVDNVFAFCLDRVISVLDEVLVCLLSIFLGTDDFSLHCLCIVNDLLDHAHDSTSSGILLVGLKAWRWWGSCWLLNLHQSGCLLGIEALQDVEGSSQQLLGGTLIGNCSLELFVLLLAVFSSPLHLDLHLSHLALELGNGIREGLDGVLEVFDLGSEVRLCALFFLCLEFVGVELVCAEVLVLDLIRLLLEQLGHHVVNGLLDTGECIQSHSDCKGGQAWALDLASDRGQELGGLGAALRVHLLLDERWVEGFCEEIMRVVRRKNCQCLRA